MNTSSPRDVAQDLLSFIDASPTPFHATSTAATRLEAAGFSALREDARWSLAPGDRRYVVRNGSTILAFVVGSRGPADAGFAIIGAHTDSPNLRVKPNADLLAQGYREVGVEIYGGVLLSTWTDRDLGLAGRAFVRGADGVVSSRLVLIRRPIARVAQLAIHLDREVNERGLILNKETHMRPLWSLDQNRGFGAWLAGELGVAEADVLSFDLMFFDTLAPAFGGAGEEFLFSARLDNLASCHAALEALIAAAAKPDERTRLIALYDNEEIGSATVQGAGGSMLGDVMARIVAAGDPHPEALARAKARSFLVSADMAHAIHPNYADKHEGQHQPRLNQGPVLKLNANARYASDGESMAVFASYCKDVGVLPQRFVMRADMPCGSTIGPIVSTREGIKAVDIGNPMLSMHSCREMAGAADQAAMLRVLSRFFGI